MNTGTLPSTADVRDRLRTMTRVQLQALADKTGIPFHTILKIQLGTTDNPRLETVRAIWPELVSMEGASDTGA